jgi:tetratricopeptide (TPR) repeat protein
MTLQERAAGRAQMLDALDRLAVRVRKDLGERIRGAEPVVALARATTSSLDALEAWSRGNQHFRNGRYAIAIEEYERAIGLDSNFAMAHKSLGVTLYWTNQRDRGDRHFERAIALSNRMTDRERLLIRADVANWRQQTDAAINLYQQFLVRYPDDISARGSLGYALLVDARWADALEQYEWLAARDSMDLNARINVATCYGALRRYPDAIRHYRAAFTIQPRMARTGSNVVNEYGQILVSAGQAAAAESLFRVQLEGEPEAHARATRSLGLLSMYRGQAAAARELFRSAVAQDVELKAPTSELRDRLHLARALIAVGKLDSARQALLETVALLAKQKIDAAWLQYPAEVAATLGLDSLARGFEQQLVGRAQAGNRGDEQALHVLRGAIALTQKDFATARQHFEGSLRLRREPFALLGAGHALVGQGQQRQAESMYEEIARGTANLYEPVLATYEARLALARLAAARGDRAAARDHLNWIMTQWSSGDRDLVIRRETETLLASLSSP